MTTQDAGTARRDRRQARLLLTGVMAFYAGLGSAGALIATGRPPWPVLVAFTGGGLMFLGGSQRDGVPLRPRQIGAAARAAGWPPGVLTGLVLLCVVAAIAAMAWAFVVRASA